MRVLLSESPNQGLILNDGRESPLGPVRAQKVYVIAANWLAEQIQAGRWPVGERLPSERDLSDMMQISRTSVRQALMALESIGILRSRRGAGHYVLQLPGSASQSEALTSLVSEGDPQEILEARRALEPEIARLAAIYRDVDDLQRLYEMQELTIQNEDLRSLDKYIEADYEFHLRIAAATHNPLLLDLERVIIDRMKAPAWRAATYTILPHNFKSNRLEHEAILNAIVAQKPREAHDLMVQHLKHHARNIRNISSFQE